MLTREQAAKLDDEDPLAALRDDFVIDDGGPIYLDGNSLGRLPRATVTRLAELVEQEWGTALVQSWDHWIDLPTEVGDRLGASFLGAAAGQVLVADSTTVNLYKLVAAAVDARAGAIVADRNDFPSDRYVVEGVAATKGRELRWMASDPVDGPTLDDVADAVRGRDVAVVVLSLVGYRSSAWAAARGIADVVRSAGAFMLWDCSHAVGAVPIALDADGTDLAVGCTYKYLNGGPGSPAFLYVRREHQAALRQPVWGWFAQRDQFAMGPHHDPVDGIGRFGVGTPPIPGLVAVDVGIEVLLRAGIGALRAKSVALTEAVVELSDDWLAPLGFTVGSPRDPARRGGHVSLRHPDAESLVAVLRDAGVVADFRAPDSIRVAPVAAYTRFVDAWDGLDRLRRIASGWRSS